MRSAFMLLLILQSCCVCLAEEPQFSLEEYYETAVAEPMIGDPAVEPASYACQPSMDYLACMDCQSEEDCPPCPQTVSWLSGPYFRVGLTGVLGDGLLDEDSQTGYTISFGGRQPLGPGLGGQRLFFDVGGSYLSAEGETTRDVNGRQVNTATNMTTIVPDAFSVTLEEIRRGGAHAGVGCYFGSLWDNRNEDPQARLGLIVGGRLSHIHGVYRSERLVNPPMGSTISPIHANTDMAGGIYFDVETLVLKRNSPLGDLQWTIDGEFAHDWVDISNFESRGLATASLMFGFMVVR